MGCTSYDSKVRLRHQQAHRLDHFDRWMCGRWAVFSQKCCPKPICFPGCVFFLCISLISLCISFLGVRDGHVEQNLPIARYAHFGELAWYLTYLSYRTPQRNICSGFTSTPFHARMGRPDPQPCRLRLANNK